MKYAFKFVCQEGKLEAQAILLVASLKRFLRCDYELVAAVTFNNRKPSDVVLEFLKKLGVRIVDIKNNTGNPYNNPIFCLGVPTDAQKNVLMDTDLLCMREFQHEKRFSEVCFNAKQAHKDKLGPWEEIFKACKVDVPAIRVPTTVSHEYLPPYFNAGFVAIHTKYIKDFTALWMDCHDKIKKAKAIKNGLDHFIPQISMAVALHKFKIDYELLDERYNHPIRYSPVLIDGKISPFFCHYHTPKDILSEPSGVVRNLVRSLAEETPEIYDILKNSPEYFELLSYLK